MTTVWSKFRTRAGVTVVAGVLGVAGMGTAAAAIVVNQGAVEETAPVITPTTSAPTVAEQTSAEVTPVVEPPVVETPAATVETVTNPTPSTTPGPDSSIGTIDANGHYTPAIPVGPGEPPLATDQQAPPTVPNNQGQVSFPSDGPATIGG